jgi:membrane-associated phospholipid phosphatase
MKKLLSFFVFFCVVQASGFSESVFTLDTKTDIIIGAFSLGIGTSPFFIKNEPESIPTDLNKTDVNGFDRPFMFSYKKPLDLFSDYGGGVLLVLPVISALANIRETGSLSTYGIMYAQALSLALGTTFSLKNAIIRCRPYMYADGIPAGKETDYDNSFPSASATWGFLGASFLSATLSLEFPESGAKFPVIIGSYALATALALMRVISGSHFPTDILAGAAIGSLYGWLIPLLHIRKNNEKMTILPPGNGIMVSLRF